jgi:hypothetical protein
MYFQSLLSLASLTILASAQNTSTPAVPAPPAPGLTFLYTSYAECQNSLYTSQGPRGIRQAIPIIGGNFTGPRLRGLSVSSHGIISSRSCRQLTLSYNRRNPQPRRRLGRNRPANGHLQRRHSLQFPHARRREYLAADVRPCTARWWVAAASAV